MKNISKMPILFVLYETYLKTGFDRNAITRILLFRFFKRTGTETGTWKYYDIKMFKLKKKIQKILTSARVWLYNSRGEILSDVSDTKYSTDRQRLTTNCGQVRRGSWLTIGQINICCYVDMDIYWKSYQKSHFSCIRRTVLHSYISPPLTKILVRHCLYTYIPVTWYMRAFNRRRLWFKSCFSPDLYLAGKWNSSPQISG